MSQNPSGTLLPPTTVAVAPTSTTVCSFARPTLRNAKRVTVQVVNLDGSQSVGGGVYRRAEGMAVFALSTLPDFESIAAGSSAMADIDVEGTDEMEVRLTASGAGCNVKVAATRKAATP